MTAVIIITITLSRIVSTFSPGTRADVNDAIEKSNVNKKCFNFKVDVGQ